MNEIERKFLVNNLPDLTEYPFKEIEQCYIKRNPELRIRKSNNDYFITKKSDGTIKREEIETTINNTTYELLQSLIIGNLIKKTRFIIPLSDTLTAELDIYKGALKGLITVEVEFSSLKKPIHS